MKLSATGTLLILAIMAVLGTAYLTVGVLDLSPTSRLTRVTLMLDASGGLLPTSQVTMRGIKVGRVTDIRSTTTGLAVSIDLDRSHPVPVDSTIVVENLSVAGEQYIDFRPHQLAAPYLVDGAQIPADQITPTVTVSELLARVNGVISALNPDDLHTVIANAAEALSDDSALDAFATSADLYARLVQENRDLLATVFGDLSTLTVRLSDVRAGPLLSETGQLLPSTLAQFTRLIGQLEALSHTGADTFGSDEAAGAFIAKLGEYVDSLAVPLSTFATVLQPATAPMRGFKVNAGHWLDFWESTFNDNGAMRINLTVPEWQPQPRGTP